MTQRDWMAIVDLIERVTNEPDLLIVCVEEVRTSIRAMAGLEASDVARHTRALLAAATRAIASRRGPTATELSFVEDLAVTRARQGIPVHAVLSAIHVAERRIWARARTVAQASGVDPGLVLEARELYDDWAQQVREQLIVAHHSVSVTGATRTGELLHRLLQGGRAAALAAADAGLGSTGVVVAVLPELSAEDRAATSAQLRGMRLGLVGVDGTDVVMVMGTSPSARTAAHLDDVARQLGCIIAYAGPGPVETIAAQRRTARAAARAAAEAGHTGVIHVSEAACLAAIHERSDVAALLYDRHANAIAGLGAKAPPMLRTTQAWLETGRDADAAGARLYVHPNTVRNRVAALCEVTGINPVDPFRAVDLWWLCHTWLARHQRPHQPDAPESVHAGTA